MFTLQPGATEDEATRVQTWERGGADRSGNQPVALPTSVCLEESQGRDMAVVKEGARQAAMLAIKSVVDRMNVRAD